jgi:hypothetical protein
MTPHAAKSRIMEIPAFYTTDTVEALRLKISWLQQEFDLPDSFFSNLLSVREELFSEWKNERDTLVVRQMDCLRKFWIATTHILSFLNYQKDLILRMLEYEDKTFVGPSSSAFAPPWVGTSLRTFLERTGIEGVEQVNDWIQSMRFASSY